MSQPVLFALDETPGMLHRPGGTELLAFCQAFEGTPAVTLLTTWGGHPLGPVVHVRGIVTKLGYCEPLGTWGELDGGYYLDPGPQGWAAPARRYAPSPFLLVWWHVGRRPSSGAELIRIEAHGGAPDDYRPAVLCPPGVCTYCDQWRARERQG